MKREGLFHPKTEHLASDLGLARYEAWGVLEALFAYVSIYYPEGEFPSQKWESFVAWAQWRGEGGELRAALERAGYLDSVENIRVHDWLEHCDQYVKRRAERRARLVMASHGQHESSHASLPVPVPVPVPEPSCIARSPSKKGSPKARRARVRPEAVELTQDLLDFGAELGLDRREIEEQWEKMGDHEFASPRSKWAGTFRNWLRTHVEKRGGQAASKTQWISDTEKRLKDRGVIR